MKECGETTSVTDTIREFDSPALKAFRASMVPDYKAATEYKYPFGIWFRGHSDVEWNLKPGIFREQSRKVYTEETSMFHHFQLRVPEHRLAYQSTFDWLCLMQHYDMPTRLLDWTESVLVALFFAVADPRRHKKDWRLYVLNARRLNEHTSDHDRRYRANICTPTSFDTAARAQLAISRNLNGWKESVLSLTKTDTLDIEKSRKITEEIDSSASSFRRWVASPVAVFPSRLNARMVLQSSMFTIHGGKAVRGPRTREDLPRPRSLEQINNDLISKEQFLRTYRIPADCKTKISEELLTLGIHSGALFPELDKQAAYIKEQWRFDIT